MEDEQGQHLEPDWQVHDVRSGVAKVYADAKRRNRIGKWVAGGWAAFILVYGLLDILGLAAVAPPAWDFVAGGSVVLLSLLGYSSGPMLTAAVIVLVDLVIVAYQFPELLERGETWDYTATSLRVMVAPVALTLTLNGYFGALSIEAFKRGFSPGQDWRTRINPAMLQVFVFGSCAVALVLGVGTWFGAISAGFAQTDVKWKTRDTLLPEVHLQTARPDVEEAEIDRRAPKQFLNIEVLKNTDGEQEQDLPEYPENAKPITSLKGLDAFAEREVDDAFWFGEQTDEKGCELEAQGKQDRCRDDRCKHWSRVFLRACLAKSRKVEHYCDDVPHPIKVQAGLLWAQARCVGRPFETCRELLYAVQGHCHPPDAAAEVAAKKGAAAPVAGSKGGEAQDGAGGKPGAGSKAPAGN